MAGARALTRGTRHGSSEHRRGDAPTSGGETRDTEPGPHPQLAVCPSVHLSIRIAGCLWAGPVLPVGELAMPSYKLAAGP